MTGDVDSPFWWSDSTGDVHVAFTSVGAGNLGTHVGNAQQALANRRRLAARLAAHGAPPRFLNQVHSTDIVDADASIEAMPTGDGWVSTTGQPVAVLVADCLPVLFAAAGPDGRRITAAAHAGRPGLLAGVLESTAAAMLDRGAAGITAWIGPGACGSCYEVPEEMLDAVSVDRPNIVSRTSWGTAALDLRAEARTVLEAAGAAVVDVPGCTIEDPQLFSHRRSQRTAEPQGRIAGVVWC